jgi:hypothetical protein
MVEELCKWLYICGMTTLQYSLYFITYDKDLYTAEFRPHHITIYTLPIMLGYNTLWQL